MFEGTLPEILNACFVVVSAFRVVITIVLQLQRRIENLVFVVVTIHLLCPVIHRETKRTTHTQVVNNLVVVVPTIAIEQID